MISIKTLENPIMIGGCGSSGTSLLSHLLNLHSSIYCGPEMFWFTKRVFYNPSKFIELKPIILNLLETRMENRGSRWALQKRIKRHFIREDFYAKVHTCAEPDSQYSGLSTYANKDRGLLFIYNPGAYKFSYLDWCQLIQKSDNFKQATNYFSDKLLQNFGKTRWAEKTPYNCYCIKEFLETYPNGIYIYLIRDGRDIVPSLIARGKPPENAVRRWLYDTSRFLPFRNRPRCYEVKYEDLVQDPKKTLDSLLFFLGESLESELILVQQVKRSPVNHHNTWSVSTSDPISNKSIKKWKKDGYLNKEYLEQLFNYTKLKVVSDIDTHQKKVLHLMICLFL